MRWWPNIASPIVSRPAQIFSVLISKKSLSGHDEKTNDLRDRCCYHAARSLGGCNLKENIYGRLQTRVALALPLPSATRALSGITSRGPHEVGSRTSGEQDQAGYL